MAASSLTAVQSTSLPWSFDVCALACSAVLALPPSRDEIPHHLVKLLYLYFNVHTRRKVQSHEHIDGL
jgi:hypothetical protein